MKLLIAYDGSSCSEAALDDLVRAGLPETGEALVMSVAEVWLPPQNIQEDPSGIHLDANSENLIKKSYERGKKLLAEAETFANHAEKRLKKILPGWKIKSEATYGSPAWEILTRADSFDPDLIVVGSHGRSAVNRLLLGSISNKVLTEAACSVRVARGRIEVDPSPMRVIVGFDGSQGARAAVAAVAGRFWSSDCEIRLIAAIDSITPTAVGRFIRPVVEWIEDETAAEREWVGKLAEISLKELRDAGFDAEFRVSAGNPKQILVEEAESWDADCVFVGANAFGSRVERFLIGSTSAAVAARASCSVEVVRTK